MAQRGLRLFSVDSGDGAHHGDRGLSRREEATGETVLSESFAFPRTLRVQIYGEDWKSIDLNWHAKAM
jgi:hypothetical protein